MTTYPEQFHDWPEFLGTAEIAQILGVNRATAGRLMRRDGFPLLDPEARRGLKVNKFQFLNWIRGGHP